MEDSSLEEVSLILLDEEVPVDAARGRRLASRARSLGGDREAGLLALIPLRSSSMQATSAADRPDGPGGPP